MIVTGRISRFAFSDSATARAVASSGASVPWLLGGLCIAAQTVSNAFSPSGLTQTSASIFLRESGVSCRALFS